MTVTVVDLLKRCSCSPLLVTDRVFGDELAEGLYLQVACGTGQPALLAA